MELDESDSSLERRIAELEVENRWLRQELEKSQLRLTEAPGENARLRELIEQSQRAATPSWQTVPANPGMRACGTGFKSRALTC
jgi:hypothetical protein